MFPSKWLKAEDFEDDEERIVQIKDVTREEFGQGAKAEQKFVAHFLREKPLVLNKTNANVLFQLLGQDTDEWIGKKVVLLTKEVDSFGDVVRAIRVKNQLVRDSVVHDGGAPVASRPAPPPANGDYFDEDPAAPTLSSEQRDKIIELADIAYPDKDTRKVEMGKLLPRRLDDLTPDQAAKVIDTLRRTQSSPPVAADEDDDDSDPFAD